MKNNWKLLQFVLENIVLFLSIFNCSDGMKVTNDMMPGNIWKAVT